MYIVAVGILPTDIYNVDLSALRSLQNKTNKLCTGLTAAMRAKFLAQGNNSKYQNGLIRH